MAKRLNHTNEMFKITGSTARKQRPCGHIDQPHQSVEELKKEIDECGLCQLLGPGECTWHLEVLHGAKYEDL